MLSSWQINQTVSRLRGMDSPTFVIPSEAFISNVFDWQWLAKLFDTWDGRVELRGNLGCISMESFTAPWCS